MSASLYGAKAFRIPKTSTSQNHVTFSHLPRASPDLPSTALKSGEAKPFHNPGKTAQYGDNINKAGKSSRNLNRRYIFRI
jgi:hypothetical protein